MSQEKHGLPSITCDEARSMIVARPDTDELRESFANHLEHCADCARLHQMQVDFDRDLHEVLLAEPPAWLTAAILADVQAQPVRPLWLRAATNPGFQWAMYLSVAGTILVGMFAPADGVAAWLNVIATLPTQLAVALDVLSTVWGLIPLESILASLDLTSWIFEAATLALVIWWVWGAANPSDQRAAA